jgi:hypothetical protein
MLEAGWKRRMLGLAALWLCSATLGGCWVVQDSYEIDLVIDIDDPQPTNTAGYAAFIYVQRTGYCDDYYYSDDFYGQNVCEILGWDSIETAGEVTVDGFYDAGDDECYLGLFIGAYRDGATYGGVDYYPGDPCGAEPLGDPTTRSAPITVTLDRQNCFDDCYWGESDVEKP